MTSGTPWHGLDGTLWHVPVAHSLRFPVGTPSPYPVRTLSPPLESLAVSSHRVTVPEAVRLTGRARRSLYRDMAAGRLAYHVGHDDRRLLDVSELMRAYGALVGMAEPEESHDNAGAGLSAHLLAQMLDVMREQSETLAAQRDELAALRREFAELRTLPAPGQLAVHPDHRPEEHPSTPPSDAAPDKEAAPRETHDRPPAQSFADLLERLNDRA